MSGKTRAAPCRWQCDEDGVWQTHCGQSWEFTADGPQENGCKFCPYCGGTLVVRP